MGDRRREPRGIPVILAAFITILAVPGISAAQEGWHFGPSLEVSRPGSDFRLRMNSFVQGDLRSRRNFTDGDGEEPGLNGTETLLRRARIGLDGAWRRLSFGVQVDPSDESEHLKNLTGEFKVAEALRVRGGYLKPPVSPEFLTSIAKTDFVERSMISTHLAPSRDWGVMATGVPFARFDYMVGIFKGDGRSRRSRSGGTIGARVTYGALETLHLGVSFSEGQVTADDDRMDGEPVPRGLAGAGASQFFLYDPHFVDGRRRRLGADARWSSGPVAVRGEWLRASEERQGQGPDSEDLPAEVGQGWVASVTWLVTGEKKAPTVRPARPLSRGGPGAIEIGGRYESLRFDDADRDTGFAWAGTRARDIRPAEARAFTAGLSWWPESWARVMGNVVLERFEDALLAPEPGRQGQYVTILGRLQVHVP